MEKLTRFRIDADDVIRECGKHPMPGAYSEAKAELVPREDEEDDDIRISFIAHGRSVAEEFWGRVREGVDIDVGSPVLVLAVNEGNAIVHATEDLPESDEE